MSLPDTSPASTTSDVAALVEVGDVVLVELPPAWKFRPTVGIGILAIIATVAALYLARAFFVPLLIGILASYALRPLVDRLKAWYVPRAIGAALVLGALIAGASWAAMSLGEDAAAMIEKLPEAAYKVRQRVIASRADGPSTLQKIQDAAIEFQVAAAEVTGGTTPSKAAIAASPPRTPEPSVWLRDYMLTQSALLFTVAAQAPIVMLLTYFLLASGTHFRRKLVHLVGTSLSQKKDVVKMLDEIVVQIQRYLLGTLFSNVLVGIITWLVFRMLGIEQAGVWGVAAGVLHFIPYLGPVVFALVSGMAAFMQFETVLDALTAAGMSLLVSALIGSVAMTWIQSRFSRVNAAVLFIALLFFGWLWGIWGLLLGAPLVAIAKVICDRVESLKPTGELLGQ